MYVLVGDKRKVETTKYIQIKNLSFAPEVSVTLDSVPINEFSVDILTEDTIETGQWAFLYDDLDRLYAKYYITFAEHLEAHSVHLIAKSRVYALDNDTMSATFYDTTAADVALEIFHIYRKSSGVTPAVIITEDYTLASSLQSKTVRGFCPEQTKRERLVWLCCILGAYVQDFFAEGIQIKPLDTTVSRIPMERTYWRPSVDYKESISDIFVKYYDFVQRSPQQGEKYVTDNQGVTYVYTEHEFTLQNPDWTDENNENTLSIDDITIISSSTQASLIASNLAGVYFNRRTVDAEIINNRSYKPSDKLEICVNIDSAEDRATGYAERMEFAFGMQNKSKISLVGCLMSKANKLILRYMSADDRAGRIKITDRNFYFPAEYAYSIKTEYLEMTNKSYRFVFYPLRARVEGTMPASGTKTETVNCMVALQYYRKTKILEIISVDAVELNENDVAVIS